MNIERLKTLSQADRKAVLETEATEIKEGKYTKPLTAEELAFYKDQLSERSIQQSEILDELSELKKSFKTRLEPIAADIKKALQAVKFKAIQAEGKLFHLPDYDEQMIHTVDELGNIINSRRMMPEERQFRITNQKSA